MTKIAVGGYVPMTTIDFPEHLSAVIFTRGCPLACRYCHNNHLRPPKVNLSNYSWSGVRNHLLKRVGLIDAVVFSGGEPTSQKFLKNAILECKDMGYKIGLHTSGIYPKKIAEIINLIDWIGFDVKAPFEDYEPITAVKSSGVRAKESLGLILASGVNTECRTTYHPSLLTNKQLITIAEELSSLGGSDFKLQNFRKEGCVDNVLCQDYPFNEVDEKVLNRISTYFKKFSYDNH